MDRVVVYEPRRLVLEGIAGYLGREGFAVDACVTPDELVGALQRGTGQYAVVSFDGAPLDASAALTKAGPCVRHYRVVAVASVLDQVTARRLRTFGMVEVASPEIGLGGLAALLRTPYAPCGRARSRDDVEIRPARPRLTPREREVVSLVSSGMTANQIAAELRISTKTVENHKQRVFRKLDVQSQSHAVSVAMRLGLLGPAPEPAWAAGS